MYEIRQLSQRQTKSIAAAAASNRVRHLQQTLHIINADKMQLKLPEHKIMEDHLLIHIVDYIDRMCGLSSICTPRNENCARGPISAQRLATTSLHLASNSRSSTVDLKPNNDSSTSNETG